jgi:hypothetical protein
MAGEDQRPRVEVKRLSFRVTGMDPIDARELAQRVAAGLAPALSLAPGEASLPRLHVELPARQGERPDQLAERTVTRLAPLINQVSAREAGE